MKRNMSKERANSKLRSFRKYKIRGPNGYEIEEEEYSVSSHSNQFSQSSDREDLNVSQKNEISSIPPTAQKNYPKMGRYVASLTDASKPNRRRQTHYRESSIPFMNLGKKSLKKVTSREDECKGSRRQSQFGGDPCVSTKPQQCRRKHKLIFGADRKNPVVTRRVLLNINDLSDKQSENSVPEDECSPHTTINDVIPKINRVITKKVPSHIASPFERSYCSRTGSRWEGKILETV